jgi:hypothetical protein
MRPIQSDEPPEWVPRMWTRGRFNRWFWRSPIRMIFWLIAVPLVTATVTVAFALAGDRSFWVFVGAAATVFGAAQSVVFVPRAWRAYRG